MPTNENTAVTAEPEKETAKKPEPSFPCAGAPQRPKEERKIQSRFPCAGPAR